MCWYCGWLPRYFISITTQQWQMGRGEIIEAFFIFWESIGNNLIFPVVTIAAATKAHVIGCHFRTQLDLVGGLKMPEDILLC
jgi:hypothetical protein